MRRKLFLLLTIWFSSLAGMAQNIVYFEYYVDDDPGYNLANPVTVVASSITELNFTIPTTGLSKGFHFAGMRGRDQNGKWSTDFHNLFYVGLLQSESDLITYVEYFIDTDPGFGSAVPVSITPGMLVDLTFNVDLEGLEPGFHFIHVRTKSEAEVWSQVYSQIFMIDVLNSEESPINYVEYYLDSDPGFGSAVPVSITPGKLVDLSFNVDLEGLDPGIHFINVRSKSENENWCQVYSQFFLINDYSSADCPNIALLEYFVDSDPGFGFGTIIPVNPPTPLADENFVANITSIAPGEHKFFARAKDDFENWSIVTIDTFCVEQGTEFALRFDGEDDFLEAGNATLPENDFTIEAWINPDQITDILEIVYGFGENSGIQFRVNYDGSLLYGEWNGSLWNWVISDSLTILPGQWTHVAMTKEGGFCTLFINGSQVASDFVDNDPVTTTLNFGGRSDVNDRYFNGEMDEIRIWNVARTSQQIHEGLCADFTGNEAGLFGLWHFDDGTGSPVAIDSGPNNMDVTLHNMNINAGADCSWIGHQCSLFYADFSAEPLTGLAPLEVHFTDLSSGNPETWFWDFGDGSTSNLQNPVHIYNIPGIYTVNLYVTNPSSSSTKTRVDYIEVFAPEPLIADFSAEPLTGLAPLEVHFTDLSIGDPDTWHWDFGDGSASNLQNPVHIYSGFGNYSVSLTISEESLENTIVKEGYISVFQTENGDWSLQQVCIVNTPEAELMIRAGDIDNLGFGWPDGFDPFSGQSTPVHAFPWTPDPADIGGTDRIMVVSGFTGTNIPCDVDGYTYSTLRPENLPEPVIIELCQPPQGEITSASLQIFVDDIQPLTFCSEYTVKLNGITFSHLQTIINSLNQTGPIGRMLTVPIPAELLYLLEGSQLELEIDDFTTGAGDGFAIDFVKLLINENTLVHSGTIAGTVFDAETNLPVGGAVVEASFWESVTTNDDGTYTISEVPAGMVYLECRKSGYQTETKLVNLESGEIYTVDFWLTPILTANFEAFPLSGNAPLEVLFADLSTGNPSTWFWNFGDGTTSEEQNPLHVYTNEGWFDVSLTVSNENATDELVRQGYIEVTKLPTGEWVAEYFFDAEPGFGMANPVYSEAGSQVVDFNAVVNGLQDGHHTLFVRTKNDNGNWSQTLNRPFLVIRLEQDNLPEISKMEYFMDNDPGYGNGTLVNVDPSPIIEIPVEISLWDYPDGIRNLYFRVLDNHGKWSETNCRSFLKSKLANDYMGITRMEYFVDNDPGAGYGNPVEIQQIAGTVSQSFIADLSSQEAGEHRLFVRAYDNRGSWSLVYSTLFNVDPNTGAVQIIELSEGWSGISGYVVPDDPLLENLFLPVQNDLVIMQNFDGMYWPTAGVNTLLNWNDHAGYQLKMETSKQLTLTGSFQENLTISLNPGWNYLPVPNACNNPVETLFEPIINHLMIVKEIAGQKVYWPQFGVNTLMEIVPGKAYFINVDEALNLEFPVCKHTKGFEKRSLLNEAGMFTQIRGNPTPVSHVIAIKQEALCGLSAGDIIKVSNLKGQCFGAICTENKNLALTAFGDDPTTPQTDGLIPDEAMIFSLFNANTSNEYPLNVVFDEKMPQSGYFSNHGLSAINSLQVKEMPHNSAFANEISVTPNPSNGVFNIMLGNRTTETGWEVVNIHGSTIKSGNIAHEMFNIDLSNHPKGIYYLKITPQTTPHLKKLVLQ